MRLSWNVLQWAIRRSKQDNRLLQLTSQHPMAFYKISATCDVEFGFYIPTICMLYSVYYQGHRLMFHSTYVYVFISVFKINSTLFIGLNIMENCANVTTTGWKKKFLAFIFFQNTWNFLLTWMLSIFLCSSLGRKERKTLDLSSDQ